jgi:putative membrane protein
MIKNIHFTNPKLWSKKNKIIAAIVAAVLVLASIAGAVITSRIQHQKECQARSVAFADKLNQLDQSTAKAHDALATVDESVKEGEGSRLAHTQGFTLAPEGQSTTAELNDAIAKADETKTSEAAKESAEEGKCLSQQDVTDAEAAVKAVDDKTQSFVNARDAYRLTKATDEANSTMDAAKSNLAEAQKNADEQIKAVDDDSQMASDGNVKGAYDALKNVNNESHSLSTTVTISSYDEAVASIAKAKEVDQKANDIKKDLESLKGAVSTYQEAKAAEAAAASRSAQQSASNRGGSSYSSGSSSSARSYGSTGGSQSRSYSNGGGGSTSGGGSSNSGGGSSASSSAGNQSQSKTGDESWRQYVKSGSEIKPGQHCYNVGKDQYICA